MRYRAGGIAAHLRYRAASGSRDFDTLVIVRCSFGKARGIQPILHAQPVELVPDFAAFLEPD